MRTRTISKLRILAGFFDSIQNRFCRKWNNQFNIRKYSKVNPRTLLMLSLFPVLGAAGGSEAGPKTAPPAPARQPARSTIPGNPRNQAATEPAQTKIVHIYRGEGYFDNALAEK